MNIGNRVVFTVGAREPCVTCGVNPPSRKLGQLFGKHFPDTDPAYKGADSLALLRHVTALIREKGWQVGNIDATVLAQAPKLAPHIMQMRENLAAAMACDVDCVSVKATTEEKLGFTGAKQGIAAHAICLLCRDEH